jgi:CheY-like chemotaxis protein
MKKSILIIDHERLLCYGLKKALSQDLLKVDTASTYSEAVRSLIAYNYDMCLLDIRFPDVVTGFEMMEVIRHFCPETKIFLMTASDISLDDDFDENIQKAKTNGASHLLSKPFNLKQLKEFIFHALREDGNGGNDDWFKESFGVNTRRMVKRKKWIERIHFFMNEINEGEVKRMVFLAESEDISDEGIGLITPCPLKTNHVISFDEDLGKKSGVVVWSRLLDDQRCRAGIRFA